MRRSMVLLAGCVLGCAGADVVEEAAPQLRESTRVLVPERLEARGPKAGPGSSVDLYLPLDVMVRDSVVAVVDNGNDRVVLMDRDLNVVKVVGRAGGGPGEFEGPYRIQAHPEGWAVFDFGNRRFTFLTPAGEYVRTVNTPLPLKDFAVASDGAIYAPHRDRHWYLLRLTGEGESVFAARPDTGAIADTTAFLDGARSPWLAVTAGDTVHVMDAHTGELHKFAPDGSRVMTRRLPSTLIDTLQGHVRDVQQAFPGAIAAYIKDLSVTSDGELLLLLTGGVTTAALVIDPASYESRRILVPPDDPQWQVLLSAGSMFLAGDVAYVLTDQDVVAIRLAERES